MLEILAYKGEVKSYINWLDNGQYKSLAAFVWSNKLKSREFSRTELRSYERLFSIKASNSKYSEEEVELIKQFHIALKRKLMPSPKHAPISGDNISLEFSSDLLPTFNKPLYGVLIN
ncbi:hypothetical protein [Paenibacillus tianjinensis]|uniref:Uncharacterized protein n=1 Tax=Paenibacillus tianjinensis TaxID=2810347 RepID=A0ABX7LA24_9BACL|nr:hypothetical protein [Paenibacillus tianjinensis]QSF43285.1 hypothetical protein JRJ22_18635 [Paenibacillus tianjinensis]